MKICVIGAGISGLSVGQLLKESHEIEILEKDSKIGGIAKTKRLNGVPYHTVGGHCFNSKNPEVLKFVFEKILPEQEWNRIDRKAKISFNNQLIDYPIEFAVKQILEFDVDLAMNITKDFLNAPGVDTDNLEGWFKSKFGNSLAEEYFIPYNRKIWGMELSKMSSSWVKDKLPIPNKKEFFESLFDDQKDNMPHSKFFYPKSNNQNTFLQSLANGLNIVSDYPVNSIEKTGNQWLVNGEKKYDKIISTAPLKELPSIIMGAPIDIVKAADKLRFNKVSNIIWETERVNNTWTYYPSPDVLCHRHIHIGNFLRPNLNYTITEKIGETNFDEIMEDGKRISYLKKPLDYNVSEYAYVVYDDNYNKSVRHIKNYLNKIGLITLGRFGEWEYYNMDVCIESAMKVAEKIIKSES